MDGFKDGLRDGRLDAQIGRRSEYAWAGESLDPAGSYGYDYSRGYKYGQQVVQAVKAGAERLLQAVEDA